MEPVVCVCEREVGGDTGSNGIEAEKSMKCYVYRHNPEKLRI